MRIVTTIVFGICIMAFGTAQETNNLEVINEPAIIIEFENNSIMPNEKGLTVLDNLGQNILTLEAVKKYNWIWVVITCDYEIEKNEIIPYKRVDFLMQFFEKKHGISISNFEFTFLPPEECDPENAYNLSRIQFVLGGCGERKRGW